jgi:adenylosuccinate synthase
VRAHKAQAVIGAGYGDEGKGLMVDAFAARAGGEAVVVRSNGGAQAGHTVCLFDGRRHVFHHLGSGALAGAATHLSRFFVHHPMLFAAERETLAAHGARVEVTADPRGLVTTPWDMLINQAVEQARGAGRHGSCGLGFGETVERNLSPEFGLTFAELSRPGLRRRCEVIRDGWTRRRLRALDAAPGETEERVLGDGRILEAFLDDCGEFLGRVDARRDADLAVGPQVIFEGAQGLLLDQSIGVMPHVTRSNTGLANMASIAAEAGLEGIDATYVTRAYATRHGAGPLPDGGEAMEAFEIVDPTNAPNAWQGQMRYAPLDLWRLADAIAQDLALTAGVPVAIRRSLAVSCLDQARGPAPVLDRSGAVDLAPETIAREVADRLGLPLLAESWGARRTQLRWSGPACPVA